MLLQLLITLIHNMYLHTYLYYEFRDLYILLNVII